MTSGQLRDGLQLTPTQCKRLRALDQYDFSLLRDPVGPGAEPDSFEFEEAVGELRKFFALIALAGEPLAMFSKSVDSLWHRFLQFSSEYRTFGLTVLGGFVDHVPNTPSTPVPKEAIGNFLSSYEHHFGPVPPIWFDEYSRDELLAFLRGDPHAVQISWSGWAGPIVDVVKYDATAEP